MSNRLISRMDKLESSHAYKRVGRVIEVELGDPIPDHDPEIDLIVSVYCPGDLTAEEEAAALALLSSTAST